MTHKLRAVVPPLLALFLVVSLMPMSVFAATVTVAGNGTGLTVGTFVALTNPSITETATGEFQVGDIVLSLPTGFVFDATAITATRSNAGGTCTGTRSLQLNGGASQSVTPAVDATTVTFNVSRATSTTCTATITWSGIRVKATTSASGNMTVQWTGGTAQNFGAISAPVSITSFTPTSGPMGTSVVITGSNFTGTTAAKFNGVNATSYTVDSNTQITAAVPSGAGTGPITVTTPANTATSGTNYTTTTSITSFTPTTGPAGTTVTITGNSFTGVTAVNFNGTPARSFTFVSDAQITAIVPSGAGTGTIAVTTPVNTATSAGSYTSTTATWNSYNSTATGSCATATESDSFTGASQSVCAKGSGFAASASYSVAFYDGAGTARFSETLTSDASGNLSTGSFSLYNNAYAPGTWHVVAYQTGSLPGGSYSTAVASNSTSADDTFTVDGTAVPGLPTPLAALVASLGAAGFYYLVRRRALPVRA